MRKYYRVLEAWYTQINGNQGGYTYKVLLLKYLATIVVCTNVVEKKITLKNLNSKNHIANFTNSVMKIMPLYIIGIIRISILNFLKPNNLLEPSCCKKRQKKSRGRNCSFRTNLVSLRTFRRSLFPKPVSCPGLILPFLTARVL